MGVGLTPNCAAISRDRRERRPSGPDEPWPERGWHIGIDESIRYEFAALLWWARALKDRVDRAGPQGSNLLGGGPGCP